MNSIFHPANQRGHSQFGWLNSYHSFSFGNYYDPEKIHFGALRVLNDDVIAGGSGFGAHPHANMEIISIPLQGALEHRDSTGREKTIRSGEVQIMSAGTGIQHSEYNASESEKCAFLQIWIIPEKKDIPPRYDQKTFDPENRVGKFITVVAPDDPEALWINQQAWVSMGEFEHGQAEYILNKADSHGLYLFVLSGEVEWDGQMVAARDGLGIWDIAEDRIHFNIVSPARLLLMELPMQIA